jgi:hypothetical protein
MPHAAIGLNCGSSIVALPTIYLASPTASAHVERNERRGQRHHSVMPRRSRVRSLIDLYA